MFSIRIDASEGVDDLMMAIALREKYEFAASKLQLFVAKKSDGSFIHYSDVEALTLDANGCPKGFAPMIPVKSIQFYLGENYQPEAEQIYALVVVPKDARIHLQMDKTGGVGKSIFSSTIVSYILLLSKKLLKQKETYRNKG